MNASNEVSASDSEHSGGGWPSQTRIFQYWEEMKQEILRHKWFESEKAGRDIGWERAAASWMIHHRQQFWENHRPK